MRFFLKINVLLFFLLLWAPLIQMLLQPFEEQPLNGAIPQATVAELSFAGLRSGSFQESFSKWFVQSFGFRGYLVRTDNQMNVSLFKETSRRSGTHLVLGKEDFLFEKPYIDNYNNKDSVPTSLLKGLVAKLKQLSDMLADRDTAFLILISPNKAVVYPENLPDSYISPERNSRESNYTRFVDLLKQDQIAFLDSRALFLGLKPNSPVPLFAASGTHWNYYGVCAMLARLTEQIEQLLDEKVVHIRCGSPKLQAPRAEDKDLLELANLWDKRPLLRPAPYSMTSNTRSGNETEPTAVIVGASHVWQMLKLLDKHRIFSQRDFYYYFKRRDRFPPKFQEPIHPSNLDWETDVFSKDLIIVEINEAAIPQIGFGFVEAALAALHKSNSAALAQQKAGNEAAEAS